MNYLVFELTRYQSKNMFLFKAEVRETNPQRIEKEVFRDALKI